MTDTDNTFTVEYTLKVDKCPCGSGKKPEKCCGPVKPRIYSATLDSRNFHESHGIAIGYDYSLHRVVNGERFPIIGKAGFTLSHERKNKSPKIIVQGETSEDFTMRPDSILAGFDHVFVIDTNTNVIDNNKVSLAGVFQVTLTEKTVNAVPVTIYEFWNSGIHPETLGWYALLDGIRNNCEISGEIGIIVDSQLNKIEELNSGKIPLYMDFYLPKNIKLLYSSADKRDAIANKLIKNADQLAALKFQSLKEDVQQDSLKETPYPCEFFRQWYP